MRHALNNESWKSLLPETSDWLEKVQVGTGPATVSGAHHVVAVKADENDKDSFKLNAPKLPSDLAKKLTDAAKALGWRTGAGALHVAVDGASFTLVPQPSTKVGGRQLARQLGLDAAKATKELKIQNLAFAQADGLPGEIGRAHV